MAFCKCKDNERFDIFFGIMVFSIIMLSMGGKLMLLFGELEWYRALGVTLGSITVAATVGVVSSLAAQWIIKNIVLVIMTISAVWVYSLTL